MAPSDTTERRSIAGHSIRWDEQRARSAYESGYWVRETLAEALARTAAENPGRVLVVDGPVRLRAGGTLSAEGDGRETVPGTWRWSRGALVVALDGAAGEASISGTSVPWRVLADRAGAGLR